MLNRQDQIKNLMWKEVAGKGTTATLTFNFFAIMVYFYHFGNLPSVELIKGSCLLILLANILRLWISKKMISKSLITKENQNLLRFSIALNAIGWSVIFSTVTLQATNNPMPFAIMITLVAGFLSASIVTLAYDKMIFFPFQLIILVPMNVIFIYLYLTGKNTEGIYFSLIFTFFFFYQLKQYLEYRKQLTQRFNYQLDLEVSYNEVKKDQKNFINQTAKLIHASKIAALGEMAGGLAHEINNSLMVILGSTQQVERQIITNGMMDSIIETKMNQTFKSIMKIKSVIEGLKSFSLQMEPAQKEVVSLNDIIQRTLLYCQELLSAHKVRLETDAIPEVKLKCSPFQIIQILFNLTKNADDALMNAEGIDYWIKYHFKVKNDFLYISVSNSGPLISQEKVEKLFQPFFTTKDIGLGTGLSLSISKGFALDHKGDLYLEGNSINTTFTLKLPIYL